MCVVQFLFKLVCLVGRCLVSVYDWCVGLYWLCVFFVVLGVCGVSCVVCLLLLVCFVLL